MTIDQLNVFMIAIVIGWMPLFIEQIFLNEQFYIPSGVSIFFQILPPTSLFADLLLLIYTDHPVRNLIIKAFKRHG